MQKIVEKTINLRLRNRIAVFLRGSKLPLQYYRVLNEVGNSNNIYNRYQSLIMNMAIEYIENFLPVRDQYNGEDINVYLSEVLTVVGNYWGVYIYGVSGTGKTILAAHIINSIILLKPEVLVKGCLMLNVPQLLEDMRPGSYGDKEELYYKALNVDLLVLDDLGTEVLTPWVFEKIYAIVNYRRDCLKPIIFTSNYRLESLTERFASKDNVGASRLITRIVDNCKTWKIDLHC